MQPVLCWLAVWHTQNVASLALLVQAGWACTSHIGDWPWQSEQKLRTECSGAMSHKQLRWPITHSKKALCPPGVLSVHLSRNVQGWGEPEVAGH